jgi:transcriptional regulator with XRE-family HTH domain
LPKYYDINTIGGRLLHLISALKQRGIVDQEGKMNSGVFADEIGINKSQFSRITQNDLNITLSQVMEICERYNVRAGWLLEGEGNMFKEKSGAFQQPDIQLLTQMKTQIKTLYDLSLQLSAPEMKPDLKEESSDQALTYGATAKDKNQKADTP